MQPTIIDSDPGRVLWRTTDCATHCSITNDTWANYNANGRTPPIVARLDKRTPLWDAEEVKNWHNQRPGSPGREKHHGIH